MPKVNSLDSYIYEPRPQWAKPLRKTPYDQTQARPAPEKSGLGKIPVPGSRNSGGNMNGGGKRRPGHNARKGID